MERDGRRQREGRTPTEGGTEGDGENQFSIPVALRAHKRTFSGRGGGIGLCVSVEGKFSGGNNDGMGYRLE